MANTLTQEEIEHFIKNPLPAPRGFRDYDKGYISPEENEKYHKGNFAIYINEKLRFFKVNVWEKYNRPKRIYIKEVIGGGDLDSATMSVMNPTFRKNVLKKIFENPSEAGLRYSEELRECYYCSRELTDEESRRTGLGPICRTKLQKFIN